MNIKKIKFYNYYGGLVPINDKPNYEIILTKNKMTYQQVYENRKFEERIKENSLLWSTKIKESDFDLVCSLLPSLFRNADSLVCDGNGLVITLTFDNNKTQEEHVSLTLLDNNSKELNDIFVRLLQGLELPYFVTKSE